MNNDVSRVLRSSMISEGWTAPGSRWQKPSTHAEDPACPALRLPAQVLAAPLEASEPKVRTPVGPVDGRILQWSVVRSTGFWGLDLKKGWNYSGSQWCSGLLHSKTGTLGVSTSQCSTERDTMGSPRPKNVMLTGWSRTFQNGGTIVE